MVIIFFRLEFLLLDDITYMLEFFCDLCEILRWMKRWMINAGTMGGRNLCCVLCSSCWRWRGGGGGGCEVDLDKVSQVEIKEELKREQ